METTDDFLQRFLWDHKQTINATESILGDPGANSGAEGKSKGVEKMA